MVVVELLGGLGNQMFQYAAGLGLACRHNVPLLMDVTRFDSYKLWPYALNALNVPQDIAGPLELAKFCTTSPLMRRIYRRLGKSRGRNCFTESCYHFDEAFDGLGDDTHLSGFFQSERYFTNCAAEIRRRFVPKNISDTKYVNLIRTAELPISIHIRRGDYVGSPAAMAVHGALGLDYYKKAVDIMTHMLAPIVPTFFVFSDDQAWVRENITFCSQAVYVEGNARNPEMDIWLMAQCRHHVIANSSFSWWGAWLNAEDNKIVFAPRRWFAERELIAKNTRDLCPTGWILL